MENVCNRVDIKLVTRGRKANRLAMKPNFEKCAIFTENLIAVHMKKTKTELSKPMYSGASFLDISKTLIYNFHYLFVRKSIKKERNYFLLTQTACATKYKPKTFTRTSPNT